MWRKTSGKIANKAVGIGAIGAGSVFVLSDNRSGSTLLDQCLGGHPEIVSLGEVHWLRAYVLQDRSVYNPRHPLVCSCGEVVSACAFWTRVAEAVQQPLDSLQLRPRLSEVGTSKFLIDRIRRKLAWVVESYPEAYRYSSIRDVLVGVQIRIDSIALLNAVQKLTGCRYCVDSSKSPLRFRTVYDASPAHTRAIVLVRDYRAVVHSKMKRGASLEAAAAGWRRKMLQIESVTSDLPREHVHALRYESLCGAPRAELKSLCSFLGVEFVEEMLRRPESAIHSIGGSPSKFDKTRTRIVADVEFEKAFNKEELRLMRDIVGDVSVRWGY